MNFEISYHPDLIKEEYQTYFQFQRNKVLLGKWYLLLVFLGVLILGYGLFEKNNAMLISGIGALFILLYVFLRVFLGAKFMYKQFLKNIEKSPLITEGKYDVFFTEKAVVYKSQKMKNEIPWDKVKSFESNGNALYVHLEGNRLLDVFSEKLNGKDLFEKIKSEIGKRVRKK